MESLKKSTNEYFLFCCLFETRGAETMENHLREAWYKKRFITTDLVNQITYIFK